MCQHRVDLHRGDPRTRSRRPKVSEPRPGPHFEDTVLAVDARCRHDAAHRVRVMDEVLSEGFAWSEVDLARQMPDLGTTEQSDRHQELPTLPLHTGQAPHP